MSGTSDAATPAKRPAPTPWRPSALHARVFGRSLGFKALRYAALVVPALLFVAAAVWTWEIQRQEIRARLTRTVDMLNEHAVRTFDVQKSAIVAVDQMVSGLSWEEIGSSRRVHEFLATVGQSNTPSAGILLVRPDGFAVSGSRSFPTSPMDVSTRDYFEVHRDADRQTYIGRVVIAQPVNFPVFTVSRRRTSDSGQFDGVIVTAFRPDHFQDFYASIQENPRDVVVLARYDARILARVPVLSDEQRQADLPGPLPLVIAARDGAYAYSSFRAPFDNVSRTFVLRRVSGYDVYVGYGIDNQAVLRRWLADLAIYALICGGAGLMLWLLTREAQRSVERERLALAEARHEAERRAEAEARLRHSQRVDALGRMVGGVAHDFRNVLASVVSGCRGIVRRSDDAGEVRRLAELVERAADRGAKLTNRMMAFARSDGTCTEMTNVASSVDATVGLLRHTLGPGYILRVDIAPDLPPIAGDETEFETAIVNMALNGRDAMPSGGTITIRAASGSDQTVIVSVSDHGEGMSEETRSRAGEAFFTTKPSGKGTGLGLAMVRSFVEQNGGHFSVDSALGRGTTITLTMPVYQPEAAEAHEHA